MSKKIREEILICPECQSRKLRFEKQKIICEKCQKTYRQIDNKFIFLKLTKDDINDPLDRLKYFFKKYSKFYNFLTFLISPVYMNIFWELKRFIKKRVDEKDIIAINIGSGNLDLSKNISNIDIFNYRATNIVCNIEKLPFKDNSINVVIITAVLEHVTNPQKVISEIFRVLKGDGYIYCLFPFIQGFHASPYDFSRQTHEGVKLLFKNFKLIELKCSGGPTSGFLWIFQEWLSIMFSFGIKPLYTVVYLIVMVLTFPLKFLDIVLINYPTAKNISSGFIYIGQKK